MERPIKMYQADLIEAYWEFLAQQAEAWILTNGKDLPEDVKNFIAWCKADLKEHLHCKRNGDSKSFYERREEAKKAVSEKAKEYYEQLRLKKVLDGDGEKERSGEETT